MPPGPEHSSGTRRGSPPEEAPPRAAATPEPTAPQSARRVGLGALRYILPGAVVGAGLVVMAFGSETDLEGGAGIVSAGLAIYFVNWLYRIGVRGDREREAEDAARDYFERHGRWPD